MQNDPERTFEVLLPTRKILSEFVCQEYLYFVDKPSGFNILQTHPVRKPLIPDILSPKYQKQISLVADVDTPAQPLTAGDLLEHEVSDISAGDVPPVGRQSIAIHPIPSAR